ncbi:MAG: hypothetical protein ABSE82_07285 [Nitrososphaerales archaeon]|jgi:hypothetical protein
MLRKYEMKTRLRIELWSVTVAAVTGIFGVAALTFTGMSMEPVAPLLGQPFGYQAIRTCVALVCAPMALNDLLVALADYAVCFAVGFVVTLFAQIILAARWSRKDGIGRNLVPASFLVIALLIVAAAANGSVAAGASLSQPRWPTPSGIEAYPMNNVSLYSGTASTTSFQGTAHLDISFINYYWQGQTVPVSVTLTTSNGTVISAVYECQSLNSCSQVSALLLPKAYSEFTLNQPTTAFYLGSAIVKGANYTLSVSMFGGAMITHFGTTAAQ